jgi:hypothetical protein
MMLPVKNKEMGAPIDILQRSFKLRKNLQDAWLPFPPALVRRLAGVLIRRMDHPDLLELSALDFHDNPFAMLEIFEKTFSIVAEL